MSASVRLASGSLRSRCTSSTLRAPPAAQRSAFSTTHAGGGLRSAHGDHYDPPTGWLFGVKPGEKYVKEGWEGLFMYGVWGSLIATGVAYAFKPDTSIQTWALEEARRRLEKEGILEDPDTATAAAAATATTTNAGQAIQN
ncbi:hypothetical protein KEM52_005556 [Ascosphaera acerosa]|nr:hypothetical protein KEM52_005556 [Ascosphaera acerosa]